MRERDDINFEMASENVVVAVFGLGEQAEPLAERLLARPRERGRGARRARRRAGEPFAPPPPWGPLEMLAADAFLAPQEKVPLEEAEGRIAAESLAAYPPGIPNVLPGERLTARDARLHPRVRRPRRPGARRHRPHAANDPRGAWNRSEMADPAEQRPGDSGIRTFARREHTRESRGSRRRRRRHALRRRHELPPGARFGPEAIRSMSALLRDYDPALDVDVLGSLDIVDYGDVEITPGQRERGVGEIAEQLGAIVASGAMPLVPRRRPPRRAGRAAGPRGEARTRSAWCCSTPTPTPGTPTAASATSTARRFAARSRRGWSIPGARSWPGCAARCTRQTTSRARATSGSRSSSGDELRSMSPREYGDRARERVGDGPAFLSFDIDFVDPAFAPATGTPEVGGPSSDEALELRARADRHRSSRASTSSRSRRRTTGLGR